MKAIVPEEAKYTRIEYERRFLVAPHADWRSVIEPYAKTCADKYLHDSRLRLRVLTDSDTGRQLIKFTKKDKSASPYFCTISRILLSPREYELFDRLPGDRLVKTRFYYHERDRVFSLDEFSGERAGLVLCEMEAESLEELLAITPPAFVQLEVTTDPFFTGGNLCRTSRYELLHKLEEMSQGPTAPATID